MRLSIKAKQVAGVTSIVGLAVVVLSAYFLSSLARRGEIVHPAALAWRSACHG